MEKQNTSILHAEGTGRENFSSGFTTIHHGETVTLFAGKVVGSTSTRRLFNKFRREKMINKRREEIVKIFDKRVEEIANTMESELDKIDGLYDKSQFNDVSQFLYGRKTFRFSFEKNGIDYDIRCEGTLFKRSDNWFLKISVEKFFSKVQAIINLNKSDEEFNEKVLDFVHNKVVDFLKDMIGVEENHVALEKKKEDFISELHASLVEEGILESVAPNMKRAVFMRLFENKNRKMSISNNFANTGINISVNISDAKLAFKIIKFLRDLSQEENGSCKNQ